MIMEKIYNVLSLLLIFLLTVSEGFQFKINSQIGRGVLLSPDMAKRDSGSGGAMPTPQADNIQSWGKSALVLLYSVLMVPSSIFAEH